MLLIVLIFGVTIYDAFSNLNNLRASIDDQLKPVESFIVTQALVDNVQSINVEINNLNQSELGYQVTWNPYDTPKFLTVKWRPPFSWIYDYSLGEIGGYQFGYLRVTGSFLTDKVILYNLAIRFSLLLIFILTILGFLMPLSKKIPEALFISPINRFLNLVSSSNLKNIDYSPDFPDELKQLESKIIDLLKHAQEHERNKAAIEIGYIAAQLAHDLHSPLISLQSFIQEKAAKFSERDRDFLRTSLRRLNDITISLLSKYKFSLQTPATKQGYVFIVACILEVINEKRIQFLERKIDLVFHTKKEIDNFAIAYINPSELKRALSNILNNAVNATLTDSGTIEIAFVSGGAKARIDGEVIWG